MGRRLSFQSIKSTGRLALAMAAVVMASTALSADNCAAQCRADHNKCRIDTKGSPSCDARLQSCLQSCLGKR